MLHSTSDSQQRSLAFRKAGPKTRKIILATNIAESSITVPDVKYGKFFYLNHWKRSPLILWISVVLDFCRTRIMKTDTLTNFSALQLSWAARSSCEQRAGRTGRVMDGVCYRFVDKYFFDVSVLTFNWTKTSSKLNEKKNPFVFVLFVLHIECDVRECNTRIS